MSSVLEVNPTRIVRAADPDPGHHHHFHRGNRGFGGPYGGFGAYDNGGYGFGNYGHGGYGHGGYGHGGYGHGGYGHGGYGHGGFGQGLYGLGNYGLGNYGHGGYGHGGYGHGGYGSGYNNYYPHRGPISNSQSSASAASINTPFGSASYASANSGSVYLHVQMCLCPFFPPRR